MEAFVSSTLHESQQFGFIDDIIISGIDETDHRQELYNVLGRIQDYGFKLRIDKCQFGQTEIPFCDHVVSAQGIQPDPQKILSIQSIPRPTDITRLRAFLGAVSYYGKFVKNMRGLRGPLDELQEVKFKWKPQHKEAFTKLKNVLSSDLVLTHFDLEKKIIVAADVSSYGLGAVLMHEFPNGAQRPIMHASAAFNAAEKNYPQVQCEALALTFAVKKFHCYIFGRI